MWCALHMQGCCEGGAQGPLTALDLRCLSGTAQHVDVAKGTPASLVHMVDGFAMRTAVQGGRQRRSMGRQSRDVLHHPFEDSYAHPATCAGQQVSRSCALRRRSR